MNTFLKAHDMFVVTGRLLQNSIPVYKPSDLHSTPVEGFFYGPDKSQDQFWVIDRVLKTVGKGNNQKVLVRWKGCGPSFDSYVLKSSIKRV